MNTASESHFKLAFSKLKLLTIDIFHTMQEQAAVVHLFKVNDTAEQSRLLLKIEKIQYDIACFIIKTASGPNLQQLL